MCLCDCQSSYLLFLIMGVVDSELAQQVEAFALYPGDLGLFCGTCVCYLVFFWFWFCGFYFFGQPVTAGVIWEERISVEKLYPSDLPVGNSIGLID